MPDNDIDTSDAPSGVAVSLPEPVRRKVRELAQATIDARRADGDPDLCGDLEATVYGPVFEISSPLAADLYVFHRGDLFGASDYLFMLFDPASGRITADPVNLYGKWMDGDWGARLEKPLVSFTDLDGDGIAEQKMTSFCATATRSATERHRSGRRSRYRSPSTEETQCPILKCSPPASPASSVPTAACSG